MFVTLYNLLQQLKHVTKRYIKIKIITYLSIITKSAKRKHRNICLIALYGSMCT
jgi:hypothetical protein